IRRIDSRSRPVYRRCDRRPVTLTHLVREAISGFRAETRHVDLGTNGGFGSGAQEACINIELGDPALRGANQEGAALVVDAEALEAVAALPAAVRDLLEPRPVA